MFYCLKKWKKKPGKESTTCFWLDLTRSVCVIAFKELIVVKIAMRYNFETAHWKQRKEFCSGRYDHSMSTMQRYQRRRSVVASVAARCASQETASKCFSTIRSTCRESSQLHCLHSLKKLVSLFNCKSLTSPMHQRSNEPTNRIMRMQLIAFKPYGEHYGLPSTAVLCL